MPEWRSGERERELLAEAAGQFFISSVGLMTWAEGTSLRASVRVVMVRMECIVSPERSINGCSRFSYV